MRKFFALILICSFTATAAFAEFNFYIHMDVNPHFFGVVIPTGLHADPVVRQSGTGVYIRNPGDAPLPYNWLFPRIAGGGYTPRGFSLFSSTLVPGANDHWSFFDYNTLRFILTWERDNLQAFLHGNSAHLIRGVHNIPPAGRPSLVNSGNHWFGAGVLDFVNNFLIEEFWVRGNAGMFSAYFGNHYNRGVTAADRFQDFSYWSGAMTVQNFGVIVPDAYDHLWFREIEGNNFMDAVGSAAAIATRDPIANSSFHPVRHTYFMATARFENLFEFPLIIDAGFDVGSGRFNTRHPDGLPSLPPDDYNFPPYSGQIRAGGGLRVSGLRIGGIANVDVMYRLRGGDWTRDNSYDPDNPGLGGYVQPDGQGFFTHIIGAYVGLAGLVPDLGILVGATAMFRTFEDETIGIHNQPNPDLHRTVNTRTPFFGGLNLHLRYTGIPNFRFTFNNHFTLGLAGEPEYTNIGGSDVVTRRNVDLFGGTMARYHSQRWFALYNGLAVRRTVSPSTDLVAEITSRFGALTVNNSDDNRLEWGQERRTTHRMAAHFFASYTFNPRITLESGFSFYRENNSTERSDFRAGLLSAMTTTSWEAGGIALAIPVRARFTF